MQVVVGEVWMGYEYSYSTLVLPFLVGYFLSFVLFGTHSLLLHLCRFRPWIHMTFLLHLFLRLFQDTLRDSCFSSCRPSCSLVNTLFYLRNKDIETCIYLSSYILLYYWIVRMTTKFWRYFRIIKFFILMILLFYFLQLFHIIVFEANLS